MPHLQHPKAQGAGDLRFLLRFRRGLRVRKGPCAAPLGQGPGWRRPKREWHVWWGRRAQLLAEVCPQPAQREREARPGRRAQHVRQHAQVEGEGGLAALTRPHVCQAARGVRVLPGPFELWGRWEESVVRGLRPGARGSPFAGPLVPSYPEGCHRRRKAMHDEHHLPGEENL